MQFRPAQSADVPTIVGLLANDPLGSQREDLSDPLSPAYLRAFEAIQQDPNQELIVLEEAGIVIGTLQLTFIPYLTYRGGIRAQIEAVRIHADHRGKGLGRRMFEWAIDRAQERGAHVLQLTTDKQRPDAIRFYADLGFVASHEGMKLHLPRE